MRRRRCYGLARETVDGSDPAAVWEAFARFLAEARGGGGPFLLECLTHRLRGHYEGDPGAYRAALAAAEWQAKDPIARLRGHGVAQGWFGEGDLAAIAATAAAAVEAAEVVARASPFPPLALIGEMVYADG